MRTHYLFILMFVFVCSILNTQAQHWIQDDALHYYLTDISFDKWGNRFCTQQQGQLVENEDTMYVYPTWFNNEMGLLNSIRDKDDLYLHISGTDTIQRVIVMHSGNPVFDTLIEVSYLEPNTTPPFSAIHHGGGLAIKDSILYASFGIGFVGSRAQDLSDFRGKVVAYNLNSGATYIAAYGLRNPYRIEYDSVGNYLWVSDAGTYLAEEINRFKLVPDNQPNFGYPCWEGPVHVDTTCLPSNQVTMPVFSYLQNPHRAVIGGAMFKGDYYWTDYITGIGGHIDSSGTNYPLIYPVNLTSMATHPITGNLYATGLYGQIYRFAPDTIVLALPDDVEHKDTIHGGVAKEIFRITQAYVSWEESLDGTLQILSTDGKVIMKMDAYDDEGIMWLPDLPSGMYALILVNRHGVQWSQLFPVIK